MIYSCSCLTCYHVYYISPHHKLGWKWRRGAIINVLLCFNHELSSYMHISMFYMISGDSFFCPKNVFSRTITRISFAQLCTKSIAILQLIYLYKIHKGTFISYLLTTEGYPDSQEFVYVVYLSFAFRCYTVSIRKWALETFTSMFFSLIFSYI